MVALIYKTLSLFALSFVAYVILYTANQKHIAKLLKMATIVSLVSMFTIYFAPLINRVERDVIQGKQVVDTGTKVINGVGNIQNPKNKIEDNPIVNFGGVPKLPGKGLKEMFTGGHLSYPVKGTLTQKFSPPEHHGVDWGCEEKTSVTNSLDGVVKEVNLNNQIYGNHVIIDHTRGFTTLYAHLGEIVVKSNQKLFTGDLIGYASDSGNANGVHLHFEVRYNNKVVDPFKYLK